MSSCKYTLICFALKRVDGILIRVAVKVLDKRTYQRDSSVDIKVSLVAVYLIKMQIGLVRLKCKFCLGVS